MREIKFRAWDGKQMFNMPLSGIYGLGRFFGFLDASTEMGEAHKYTLMQYTGLKDKSGREIFDGGLCKIVFPPSMEGEIYEVQWVQPLNSMGNWELMNIKGSGYARCPNNHIEVIGNIYEDSHLLEAK